MKKLLIVLAGAALVAAPAMAQDNNTLKAIGQGRAVYLANCAGCHGADAKGTTAGTNGGIPDLTLIAWRDGEFRGVHVATEITGRRDGLKPETAMPCWGSALKRRWPGGPAAAALDIYKLTKYLEWAQEQAPTQRVASKK
jgi:mono/diheme cytochrome c family protein